MPTDSPFQTRASALTPAVKNLLILNGLAFLAQIVVDWLPAGSMEALGPVVQWFALWPAGGAQAAAALGQAAPAFYPWQLVTMAFLHGSFLHIAFNLFALFSIGPPVEAALGTRRFLAFYVVSVLGASLLQLVIVSYPFWTGNLAAGAIYPTLGASGGVLGVVAAFGILYPRATLFIFPIPFPIQARWLVPGAAVVSLYLGVTGRVGGVAHFAHLGGMAAGALFIFFWRRSERTRRLA